jgi:hypothetical protein
MPTTTLPTFDQLSNLVDRAVRKGGLTAAEGERLRAGLRGLTARPHASLDLAELRRRNANLTASLGYWKRKAAGVDTTTPAPAAPVLEEPAPTPAAPPAPVDQDARDAVRRVTALAQRWLHIPAKRQAATSVLAAITNKDAE